MATPSSSSREWTPRVVAAGPLVIDQSSAFRMDPDVPIVIPEINPEAAASHKGIIASANCTTTVPIMAIAPLHRAVGLRSVICSSYQSASGAGRDGIVEVLDHARKAVDQVDGLRGEDTLDLPAPEVFPRELAFNVVPHCETFEAGSDTSSEEAKMGPEMRKILSAPGLRVHATAVRVPVVVGHSVSLAISLEREVRPEEAREIIGGFPGVRVVDEPSTGMYPTPLDAAGIDDILVGRIRGNEILDNGLSLFASGDNLRKGNALNAVQTAELVFGV
jgi:aspartate-semialdehyde dehydrogenase